MQTSSPTFSVEQVELIRRLRNSGVTSQQIVEAFQALDRIDAELGTLYSIPAHHAPRKIESQLQKSSSQHSITSFTDGQHNNSFTPLSNVLNPKNTASIHSNNTLSRGSQISTNTGANTLTPSPAIVTHSPNSVSALGSAGKFSDTLRDVAQAAMSGSTNNTRTSLTNHSSPESPMQDKSAIKNKYGNSISLQNSMNVTASPHVQEKIEMADVTVEKCHGLLLSQSQETLRMLVQKYLILIPDFDQHKHASALGIDEVALYMFIQGEWQAIDPVARHKLLTWYFNQVKCMDWFLDDLTQLFKLQEYPDGLDVHFVPRRERFTFKEKHLEVLEMFFKKGQYPTQEEKEHIANECNIAMAVEIDRELADKEKMTHINVTNWFSNRRKEIKRIAKKGGIETEKVILPSRLKAKMPSHMPTYNELQEEQAARQKMMGFSQSVSMGTLHGAHYPNFEMDSSSQDNSNFNSTNDSDAAPSSDLHDGKRSSPNNGIYFSSISERADQSSDSATLSQHLELSKIVSKDTTAAGDFNYYQEIKNEPEGD